MTWPTVAEMIPVLMTAIGPAILISAVGLLLLTMTNRLGRIIDRSRMLDKQLEGPASPQTSTVGAQLDVLWRRAKLIRMAITLVTLSALFAASLIIVLFLTALLRLDAAWALALLFVGCLSLLIGALAAFIGDINLSLVALRLEISDTRVAIGSSTKEV